MKRTVSSFLLATGLIVAVVLAFGADAKKVYFPDIDDESIYAVVEKEKNGKLQLSVAGVPLEPENDTYIEMVDEGYLSGVLSPDKARILVGLGHIDEKNVWVINLKAKQLEFTTHDTQLATSSQNGSAQVHLS